MNTKRAITIGLLISATIGLIGCAISVNKAKETKADIDNPIQSYEIENIEKQYNKIIYTTKGKCELEDTPQIYYKSISLIAFTYEINIEQPNTTETKVTAKLKPTYLQYLEDYDEGYLNSILLPINDYYFSNSISFNQQQIYGFVINVSPLGYFEDENDNTKTVYNETVRIDILASNSVVIRTLTVTVATNPTTYSPTYEVYTDGSTYTNYEYINLTQTITDIQNFGTYQFQTGYSTAETSSDIVDIRGLMLNILTMPFTFIRQAFNVTMWEGTPYQFNVSNFILALIAIATILFIIKLFTSGFSAIGNYTNSRENRAERHSRIELNKARTRRENNLADKGK